MLGWRLLPWKTHKVVGRWKHDCSSDTISAGRNTSTHFQFVLALVSTDATNICVYLPKETLAKADSTHHTSDIRDISSSDDCHKPSVRKDGLCVALRRGIYMVITDESSCVVHISEDHHEARTTVNKPTSASSKHVALNSTSPFFIFTFASLSLASLMFLFRLPLPKLQLQNSLVPSTSFISLARARISRRRDKFLPPFFFKPNTLDLHAREAFAFLKRLCNCTHVFNSDPCLVVVVR